MAKVKITLRKKGTNTDLFRVYIDEKKIPFEGDEAVVELESGAIYILYWIARGNKGSKYTIKITKPVAHKFRHDATLDGDKKDSGRHKIDLRQEVG